MDATALRDMQAPLKAKYRDDPEAAVVTLSAEGGLDPDGIACRVETGRALIEAGLHPATGGTGLQACSGDMLLEALVAFAGVTLRAVATALEFRLAGGRVRALRLTDVELSWGRFEPVPGTERELRCDLVLLAMGFTGAERAGLIDGLGVDVDARGNVARDGSYATSVPGVFAAGDMGRGQSLIVWAIAEGRSAAADVDAYLMGETALPAAIPPTARPLT